jgi:hypothetical protein
LLLVELGTASLAAPRPVDKAPRDASMGAEGSARRPAGVTTATSSSWCRPAAAGGQL